MRIYPSMDVREDQGQVVVAVDISINELKHSVAMHMLVLRNQIPNSKMERANRIGWRLIDSNDDVGTFDLVVAIEAEILRESDSK